jgi:hypothetical protein
MPLVTSGRRDTADVVCDRTSVPRDNVTVMSQRVGRGVARFPCMPVYTRAGHIYGASADDIRDLLQRPSAATDETDDELESPRCRCGGRTFHMALGLAGGTFVCATCHESSLFGESGAESPWDCECEHRVFDVMLAHEDDGARIRAGARCGSCGRLSLYPAWPPMRPLPLLGHSAVQRLFG